MVVISRSERRRLRAVRGSLIVALGTLLLGGTATGGAPQGGYESPLVRLQQLVGASSHLHTDEVRYRAGDGKLFHCSYTFGVIDARDPERMAYLAENLRHTIPGDDRRPGCIHLAWDGEVVYTVHRGNIDNPPFLSGWELRPDPADPQRLDPVQLPVLQEPGISYEGIDTAGGYIYVAQRKNGMGIYRREAGEGFVRVGTAADLSNAWGVRVRGTTAFVSDGLAGLAIVDVADPGATRVIGRAETGGQARGLALAGDFAYVAAGSAGLVVVDVSNPAEPRVVGRAATPGSAIRVDHSAGRVYVAAWNDARVYDVSEPTAPRFIGAVRLTRDIGSSGDGRPPVTSRTLGVAARDDVMFVGNWHVIYSYRVHPERVAPNLLLPEEINLVDFGPVAPGESATVPLLVTNQGTAPLTVTDVRVDSPAFTVEPARLRLPAGEAATIAVTYTASQRGKETAILRLESDDPDDPARSGYLVGNQPGLGVGKPLPVTTLELVDGGQWSSSEAKGQVLLLAYFATF
jgi:hypothetical protein